SAYLGKSADLTLERLQAVAAALADSAAPENQPARARSDYSVRTADSTLRAPLALPTGTVTFLFADIDNPTAPWEQHPQALADRLARGAAILTKAITAGGGSIFKTSEEVVGVAFANPLDALTTALAAQQALEAELWGPAGPLHARMALHTGVVAGST